MADSDSKKNNPMEGRQKSKSLLKRVKSIWSPKENFNTKFSRALAIWFMTALPVGIFTVLFCGIGWGDTVHRQLQSVSNFYSIIGGGTVALCLVLHLLDVSYWSGPWKCLKQFCMKLVVCGLVFSGIMSAEQYPQMPIALFILALPSYFSVVKHVVYHDTDIANFFVSLSHALFLATIVCLGTWGIWVGIDKKWWGESVRWQYEAKMACEKDEKCLAAFLLWVSQFICAMICFLMGVVCLFLGRSLQHRGGKRMHTGLKIFGFILALCVVGMWVASSISGAAMELSNAVTFVSAASLSCIAAVVCATVGYGAVKKQIMDIPLIAKMSKSFLSDWVKALLCCMFAPIFFFVLLLSVFNQFIRKNRCVPCTKHIHDEKERKSCLTKSLRRQLDQIIDWPWTSVLTKICFFCFFYICVSVGVGKLTNILLSSLNTKLAGAATIDADGNETYPDAMGLGLCTAIFMLVGLCMFLAPPVPGVPVYISGGVILTPAAMRSWNGEDSFLPALGYTTIVCFIIKCMAITGQQKGFGGMMSGYVSVRKAVGVNDITIRAVREILVQPGLTMAKVCVLCGGPDWPTSVLTGILKLSLVKMLIGSIPVIVLIAPCVAAGGLLAHPKNTPNSDGPWKTISSVVLALAAMAQTLALLAAMYYIENTSHNKREKLLAIPDDPEVKALELKDKARSKAYRKATHWKTKMTVFPRLMLGGAALVLTLTCYGLQFMGSQCFVAFTVTDTIKNTLAPNLNICDPSICASTQENDSTFIPSLESCKNSIPVPKNGKTYPKGAMFTKKDAMGPDDTKGHCIYDPDTSKCKFDESNGCCTLQEAKTVATCIGTLSATAAEKTACKAIVNPTKTTCLTTNQCTFTPEETKAIFPLKCKGKLVNFILPLGWMAIAGFCTGVILYKIFGYWAKAQLRKQVSPAGDRKIDEGPKEEKTQASDIGMDDYVI